MRGSIITDGVGEDVAEGGARGIRRAEAAVGEVSAVTTDDDAVLVSPQPALRHSLREALGF